MRKVIIGYLTAAVISAVSMAVNTSFVSVICFILIAIIAAVNIEYVIFSYCRRLKNENHANNSKIVLTDINIKCDCCWDDMKNENEFIRFTNGDIVCNDCLNDYCENR